MTIASRIGRWLTRAPAPPDSTAAKPARPERWEDQWESGAAEQAWIRARRDCGRLYADLPDDRLARLRERAPDQARHAITAADRILQHEFNLLGSGPYVPRDPARPPRGGYVPIDWYLDPVSGLRFPERVPYRDWNLLAMRPGLADVKLPWELGRCQHWVTLGQAYRLTGDDRYAAEIVLELDDFVEANPVGSGIHWTCTMDVALRALNWAIAAELVRRSAAFDAGAMQRFYRSLFAAAAFIETNLENTYEVTSNHFLSNVVGLYGAALVFGDLPAGRKWRDSCRGWLEQEMRVQVLPDGADYESSIPYHRLVAELFLSGCRLARLDGTPLSPEYQERLRAMIDFLHAVSRPDGLMPQVGDADDGRVHVFSSYAAVTPQDPRHLFGPAAAMFGEPQWLSGVDGTLAAWEAGWWGAELPSPPPGRVEPSMTRLFEDAGVFVARTTDAWLLATNGRVGTNGFGNHKHNDLLGFEFSTASAGALLVDPGSYVYTSDPDARNLFRSTGYHNTLCVDGVEQNDLKAEFLFRLFETSTVEHLGVSDTPAFAEYRGSHTGYARLARGVVHERAIRLVKRPPAVMILDRLRGEGEHDLRWHFHLAPGVAVEAIDDGELRLSRGCAAFRFRAPKDLRTELLDAWYSPSYGVRVPCRAIEVRARATVSSARTYFFAVGPEGWLTSGASVAALAVFQADDAARERRLSQ